MNNNEICPLSQFFLVFQLRAQTHPEKPEFLGNFEEISRRSFTKHTCLLCERMNNNEISQNYQKLLADVEPAPLNPFAAFHQRLIIAGQQMGLDLADGIQSNTNHDE